MSELTIFEEIIEHEIQGVMFHSDMANMFDFMAMRGEKRCQEYHYAKENMELREVERYVINNLGYLPLGGKVTSGKDVIPQTWRGQKRTAVSMSDRSTKLKELYTKWKEWEIETVSMYQTKYKELCDLGAYAHAKKVLELACDVDCEIKHLERKYLEYNAVGWSIEYIMEKQDGMHDHYKEKLCELLK